MKRGIGKPEIKFKVANSWLKNYDMDTVKLHRYVNNNWIELDTSSYGSDDIYHFFKATSPGFSFFAITN